MNASELGCGAAHQLAITAAKAGWELRDFTSLTQSEEKCKDVLDFLRGDKIIAPKPLSDDWTVDDEGNIRLTLTSNGFNIEQWEKHLHRRRWRLDGSPLEILRHVKEAPTKGVIYNIVVHPLKNIGGDKPSVNEILKMGEDKDWIKPHWEVACLIRDTFTDEHLEAMGLMSILVMHQPVMNKWGDTFLLVPSRRHDGHRICFQSEADKISGVHIGLAFQIPQKVA